MSSAAAMGGDLPLYNYMSGRAGSRICAACSHIHERIDGFGADEHRWFTGCGCGCVASGSDYLGTNVSLDNYKPRSVDELAELCPVHHLAGKCAGHVGSHTGGVRGVDEGGDLRGGGLVGFLRFCLSGLFGDQRGQLVRQRGRI